MAEFGDLHDLPDLDDLRALVAALIELESGSGAPEDDTSSEVALRRVGLAIELKTLADQTLHDAVEQARAQRVPWQQIGDVLGISRQAAFQRFRHPDEPRATTSMSTSRHDDLIPRAEAAYRSLASDDYEAVRAQMTFLAQRALNEQKVMGVWSQVVTQAGSLEALGDSFLRPSGSNVVVETPLSFEAGDFVGRIAYNRRDKIVGMLILLPEDAASAPF